MIRVVVPVPVKEGMKDEFLKTAQPLVEASRAEKGCVEYNLVDSTVKDQLYFVELWESMEDLKNHSQAPHSKKYGELMAPLKNGSSKIEIYETEKREAIFQRRSIRDFTAQAVSKETLEKILKAGMFAPSAGNQQGWEFIVIRNREILDGLALMSPYATPLKKAGVAILVLGNKNVKYPQNLEQDLSAATQNILLQITEEGLGGVWLGISPEEDRIALVRKTLDLPRHLLPFAIIPLGHSAEKDKSADRWNPEKVKFID